MARNLKSIVRNLAKQDESGHVQIGNYHFWVYEDGEIEGQKGPESFYWENMTKREREELYGAMIWAGIIEREL